MSRSTNWTIEEVEEGSFSVKQGRRSVKDRLGSLQEATKVVLKDWEDGQKVLYIEADGYRNDLTRTIIRKKAQQPSL